MCSENFCRKKIKTRKIFQEQIISFNLQEVWDLHLKLEKGKICSSKNLRHSDLSLLGMRVLNEKNAKIIILL